MTDGKGSDDTKTERLLSPRKLELKKTVETGQVQQKFAHGRSKMVRVEVRKKRTYAPDGRGHLAKVGADGEGGAGRQGGGRDGGAGRLTNEEKAARARALQDAVRRAEESPAGIEPELADVAAAETVETPEVEAVPEAGPVEAAASAEAGASAEAPEPEPAPVTGEPPEPAEPQPASADEPAAAEPTAAAEAPAEAQRIAPTPAPGAAHAPPAARAPEGGEDEGPARTKRAGRGDARRPASAARRGEPRRRAGRLTVSEALDDRGEERVRSLAAVRRARMKERAKQSQTSAEPQKIVRDVIIPETITVQELSNRMAERSGDVIKALINMGVMATLNQAIDADTAEVVTQEFGHRAKRVSEADVEIGLKGEQDRDEVLEPRPPVVTVMGHVDHGKTSLLDAMRKTDVAAHEAGGITQHIGAYQIRLETGNKVTFLDTPGHAAFTQMRARGATVTDIVVLVVAADDGVMPQTIEAISHAKAAGVPIIVAINKIDRPDANPQRIRTALLQHDVVIEDMGGDVLCVEVSAKTGEGLDKVIEAILLQAEVLDLHANPNRSAEGVVVESKMERGRGTVATVLVQRGSLNLGDIFVAGSEWGRVRSLFDASGAALESAGPGMPVEVLGLNGTPAAGDEVSAVDSEARAREVSDFRKRKTRDARTAAVKRGTFEQLFDRIRDGGMKELAVVIKADVHGSAEAIVGALDKLATDEVGVQVLHSGVGGINESDVTLAGASSALIIGFNVRANPQARELSKRDGVEIRYYSIIYDLVDDVKALLSGMLAPQLRENILGYAEIREVFSITKVGKVAGCMVTEGLIRRGARVRLLRDDTVIHEGELSQLKRFKDDVREVKDGYDCGVAFANYQDIQVGDKVECFELQEVERKLA